MPNIIEEKIELKTLDLVRCAELGINYLTRNPLPNQNPELNYLPYFGGKIPLKGLPRFERTPWDYGDGTGRFLEALILAREMTGNKDKQEVDEGLKRLLIYYLNENDGLSYRPETPWSEYGADIWAQRGTLLALSLWYEKTGDREIIKRLNKLVAGLSLIAVREGEYAYLKYFWTGREWLTEGNTGICFGVLDGLNKYFKVSDDERALDLAVSLVKSMLYRKPSYFNSDGSFSYPDESLKPDAFAVPHVDGVSKIPEVAVSWEIASGHVTSRISAAVGIIHLGVITGNKEYIEWGKKIHDWLYRQGNTFGWIPENLRTAGREVSEMCNLVDMIDMQMFLGRHGYPEYWDCVEQYVRNHLVGCQFGVTPALMELISENLKGNSFADTDKFSYQNVLQRLEGGFAGPTYPDDLFTTYPKSRTNPTAEKLIDISGCCAPSGIKALYLAWSNIVTKDDKGIWINLALSRKTEWVDVISYVPYKGMVNIVVHETAPIYVRIPGWVSRADVRVLIDEEEKVCEWDNGYIVHKPAKAGQRLSIRYPLRKFSKEEISAGIPYLVTWEGDTVVSISTDKEPILGIYNRRHF